MKMSVPFDVEDELEGDRGERDPERDDDGDPAVVDSGPRTGMPRPAVWAGAVIAPHPSGP